MTRSSARALRLIGRLGKRAPVLGMLCWLVWMQGAGPLRQSSVAAQTASPLISVTFGPQEAWNPDTGAILALHQCGSVSFSCVQQVMQQDGASDAAVAFYRLTGWFLADLSADQSAAPVQLATVFNPWRANENDQPALLGGVPAAVYPEQEAQLTNMAGTVERDQDYAAIQAAHPMVMFWQSSPTLAGVDTSPSGGPRVLFDYRLLDGCHACAIVGLARFGFDFDPDGTFEGAHYLGIQPPATAK